VEKAKAKKDLDDPLFQEIFNPMGPASSMSKASQEIQLAVVYINLGISYLAHARDMRHHLATTTAEQAAISGTAEHASASAVVVPRPDMAHSVSLDLMLKARELLATANTASMKHGVLNIRLACLVNLALTSFEQGHDKDALGLLSQYLDTLVNLGRDKCIGCGQTRHQDMPMLTCSGCGVARSVTFAAICTSFNASENAKLSHKHALNLTGYVNFVSL
jgi:hypothetical protein